MSLSESDSDHDGSSPKRSLPHSIRRNESPTKKTRLHGSSEESEAADLPEDIAFAEEIVDESGIGGGEYEEEIEEQFEYDDQHNLLFGDNNLGDGDNMENFDDADNSTFPKTKPRAKPKKTDAKATVKPKKSSSKRAVSHPDSGRSVRICSICNIATGQLAFHMDRNHKMSKKNKAAAIMQSTTKTNRIVRNSTFYDSDLQCISKSDTVLGRVKELLRRRSMPVIEGERPNGPLQIDNELADQDDIEEQQDEQPLEAGAESQLGSSKKAVSRELQRCGLYETDRVEDSELIAKYVRYMQHVRVTTTIATQYISAVRKVANYVMRSSGVEGPLTASAILRNSEAIYRFCDAYFKVSGNWGSKAKLQKAIATFVAFLRSEPNIGMENDDTLRALAKQLSLRLSKEIGKAQHLHQIHMNELQRQIETDGYQISLKDLSTVIYNKGILARMQQIMGAGANATDSDYVFFVGYLMVHMVSAGARRPEVVDHEKLRLLEWNCRAAEVTTMEDGEPYPTTTLAVTNHKCSPAVLFVIIKQEYMAMFEHYMNVLRPKYSKQIDKSLGVKAPFFVHTRGVHYSRPQNAMNVWTDNHKPKGIGPIRFTVVRHLAAAKNSRLREDDPAGFAATALEMGHTPRTQTTRYAPQDRKKAIIGQRNVERFIREDDTDGEEVDRGDNDAGSSHPMASDATVATEATAEPKKRKGTDHRTTTFEGRLLRTGSSSGASAQAKAAKESSTDKFDKAFFLRFPISLNGGIHVTDSDVVRFGITRMALRDKYRYAQRDSRQDMVAYELFRLPNQLDHEEKELFIANVMKLRDWDLKPDIVLKRLSKMRKGQLSDSAVNDFEHLIHEVAPVPKTQDQIDSIAEVRFKTQEEQNQLLANLCADRFSSAEKVLFAEIVRANNAFALEANPKKTLFLILKNRVDQPTTPSPTGGVSADNTSMRSDEPASRQSYVNQTTPSPTGNDPADNFSFTNNGAVSPASQFVPDVPTGNSNLRTNANFEFSNEEPEIPTATKVPHCRPDTEYPVIIDHHDNNSFPGIVRKVLPCRGTGIVTTEPFKRGDTICTYGGTTMTYEQHLEKQDKRTERQRHRARMYLMFLDVDQNTNLPRRVVEGHHSNSLGPLINHSQQHPNVEPFEKTFITANGEKHKLLLFRATRSIVAGSELFYKYHGYENLWWAKSCWCAKCDGKCYCKLCGGKQRHEPDQPESPRKTPTTPSTPPGSSMSHTRESSSVDFDAFAKMCSRRGLFTYGYAKGDGHCAAHALAATINQHGFVIDFNTIANLMSNLDAPLRDEGVQGEWFTYDQVYWYLLTTGMPFVIVNAADPAVPPSVLSFGTENAAPETILGVALVDNHWVPIVAADSHYVIGHLEKRHEKLEMHHFSEGEGLIKALNDHTEELVNSQLDRSKEQRAVDFAAECKSRKKVKKNIKNATNTARSNPILRLNLKKKSNIVSNEKDADVPDNRRREEEVDKSQKKKSKVSCKEMPETTSRKKHDGDGKGPVSDNKRSGPSLPSGNTSKSKSHRNVNASDDASKEKSKNHKTSTVQFGTVTIFEVDGSRAVTTADNIPPDYASVNTILRELHGLRTGRSSKETTSGFRSWYTKTVATAKEFKRKAVGDYLRAKALVELKRNSARNLNQLAIGRSYDSLIAMERSRLISPSLPTFEENRESATNHNLGGESNGVGSNDDIIWFANQNELSEGDDAAKEKANDVAVAVLPSDTDNFGDEKFPMSNPLSYCDTSPRASYDESEQVWESLDPQPRPCLRLRAAARRNEDEQFHRTVLQQPRLRITPAHQFAQMASFYQDLARVERTDKPEPKHNVPRLACQDVANFRLQPIVESIPLEDIEQMQRSPDEASYKDDENEKPIMPLVLERCTSSFSVWTTDSGYTSD